MSADSASIPQAFTGLANLRRWSRFGATLLAGACLTFAQQPWGFWPALLFVIPPIIWLWWARPSIKQAAFTGWTVGFGMMLVGLYWIAEAFLVDIARHGWMIPFAIGGLAAGLALFWGAAFALARWLVPRPGALSIIALAFSLTAFEMARTYVLTGFPWGMLAYGWMDTPVAQLSALIGPHLLNLYTLVIAGLLACAGPRQWHTLAAAALLFVGWETGTARLEQEVPLREDAFAVRVVQPNATQREKWDPTQIATFYDRALSASMGGDYDVVIWPETAVPQRIETEAVMLGDRIFAWDDISRVTQGRLALIGTRRVEQEPDWNNWYNSLAVVGPLGEIIAQYDKHSLVPGGEFLPFERQLSRLGLNPLASNTPGGYVPGPGPQSLAVEGMPRVLPLICYEAIFPHELRTDGPRPDWIVHITNDAWFGASAGPWQHLAQARYRAIEQGLPLARAANTGISAIIDPYGRILQSLPIGESGFLDAVLPAPIAQPPYAQSGDLPGLLVVLAGLLGLAAIGRGLRD